MPFFLWKGSLLHNAKLEHVIGCQMNLALLYNTPHAATVWGWGSRHEKQGKIRLLKSEALFGISFTIAGLVKH